MSRAQDLHRLQLLDQEADTKRRRLTDVEKALRDTTSLERAAKQLANAATAAHRCTAHQTDLELSLQGLVERIGREEERLYGGSVRNPKQLEELQEEVASLRRRQQTVEDDLLAAMIESEDADETLFAARTEHEAAAASYEASQAELQAEHVALVARLSEIEEQRASAVGAISPADLATYEALRRRKGGLAVAVVRGDACTACGVAVSANRLWHLREGDLVQCGNCERIIVLL